MSTLKNKVNTTKTTMKGERKMNMKANWNEVNKFLIIYRGEQERIEEILKGLYDAENWHELHVAQWIWLSLDGEREKAEWFQKFGVPKVWNYCFACERADSVCGCCPITDSSAEECLNGLYAQWLETFGEEREEVAWQIANLEWK